MKKFDKVLILTDMDGTLLNGQSQISEEDGRAIDYFIENGGLFSVATGRAKRSVENFLPALHTSAPSIVHNGSLIVDLRDGANIRRVDLGDAGMRLVEDILAHYPEVGVEVCLPDDQYVANTNERVVRHHLNVGLVYKEKDYREIEHPWLKLNLLGTDDVITRIVGRIEEGYSDYLFAQHSFPHLSDVGAVGASKGDSALWLRDHLGVSAEDFYTVGDGLNDIELLQSSGANSYAPANAKEPVLACVSHVLPDNDSGAIAALIEILDEKYSV